jgi:cytidylate kinase
MYRAIALFAMQRGYIAAEYFDKESLINSLPTMDSIQIQSNWALPKCI